jgi:MFS family permease
MDVLRGIIMLAVGALALTDNLSVPVVLIAAFLAALCSVFFGPSVSTVLIDVIPHDEIVRGQSVQSGIVSLINLAGKALSGALVAFVGVPLIIMINGVSYLISAFTEMFIDVPKTKRQGEKVTLLGILKDFKTALVEVFTNKFLKIFIPSAVILNLLGAGPLSLMLPFVLEKGYTVEMYGIFMAVETAGSLICVFLLGIFKMKKLTRYYLMAIGFILSTSFIF